MNWQEVCEHTSLSDLPFKIELNETGQLIMSPVRVSHSAYQGVIGSLLDRLLGKNILMECAIKTRKGTKVADVAWASPLRFSQIKHEVECSIAPEICVEVVSISNTEAEMIEKRQLYFEQGAQEVWICSEKGKINFYGMNGKLAHSELVTAFPDRIEI